MRCEQYENQNEEALSVDRKEPFNMPLFIGDPITFYFCTDCDSFYRTGNGWKQLGNQMAAVRCERE